MNARSARGEDDRAISGPRLWAARLALAVGLPVLVLLGLEGGLRWAGFGKPSGFLIPDEKPGWYRTNPDFVALFLPGNFDLRPLNLRIARHKAPGTVRIVVLGESAAQGVPVPSFAFAPQLRAQLRHRFPGKEIEVIDTGIVAVNSHVIYRIARDLRPFEPDLFVVYAGNNEVVGPYGPGCAYLSQMPPLWIIRASVLVRSSRTGQLFSALVARTARLGPRSAEWGGMSMFVNNAVAGDDPRLAGVYKNFAANLRGIVRAASTAGARTLLCTVVANLKDCPPFLSLHRSGLSASEIGTWRTDYDSGRTAWMLGEAPRARTQLEAAVRLDPQFAECHYMLGALDLQGGDVESARREYAAALHWDALRFRPDPEVNRVIREVAREFPGEANLLDCAAALGADPASTGPISGRELLFEHVHFDWPGNYQLGRIMARAVASLILRKDPGDTGWLDEPACSDALAYTPHERLPMLLRIDVLLRKPPFTNQLTHVEDEARMARAIAAATRTAASAATLENALQTAAAALAADPGNPALAGVLEGIKRDQGDLEGALGLARRAAELLPRDFALSADEASILTRLNRFPEAEQALRAAAGTAADLDLLLPVYAEFWRRTRRFPDGLRYLDQAMLQRPRDLRLRMVRAQLRLSSGDLPGAEREFRSVLDEDPANDEALEGLVSLLTASGRLTDADRESVAAADRQPRNQNNSLRAAQSCEAKDDVTGQIHNLQAAERSGPVSAAFELTLALKLFQTGQTDPMMFHLAEARRLSEEEGDSSVTASISALIGRMQAASAAPRLRTGSR